MAEMGMVINSGTTAIPGIDKRRCYRETKKKKLITCKEISFTVMDHCVPYQEAILS